MSWPSGKGVVAITIATWVQLTFGKTIYLQCLGFRQRGEIIFLITKKKTIGLVFLKNIHVTEFPKKIIYVTELFPYVTVVVYKENN